MIVFSIDSIDIDLFLYDFPELGCDGNGPIGL